MDIEDLAKHTKYAVLQHMVDDLMAMDESAYNSTEAFQKTLRQLARKYKHFPNKQDLGTLFRHILKTENRPYNPILYNTLIKKSVRSDSGILNVSVSMPPDTFSCKFNCYFCPNEPGMPRSYLSNEDVFQRAQKVNFDTVLQAYDRFHVLEANGHPIDKVEYRVLGGTFSSYDHSIADTFIRDLYYAANTYYEDRTKPRATLEEEQAINVHAKIHVVGLGIETRPDTITPSEIVRFRRYGITRVELGIQHTDDNLLQKLNRGHTLVDSKNAIRLLKNYGFKLELHIMTDLPGATPDGDKECYRQVLQADPDLIPDYMKDYPCLDVAYTKVRQWKLQGKWKPYAERTLDAKDLVDVLVYRQSITPKYVRVNRIQRDFKEETETTIGFQSISIKTNLAQLVKDAAEHQGIYCQCIRCCEVRNETFDPTQIVYAHDKFEASGATEYFLYAAVPRPNRPLLLGFLRLRLGNALEHSILPELQGATAMIRELHVYGKIQPVGSQATTKDAAQHLGIGTKLLSQAESIASRHDYTKMAIISGIGVRDYYRKRGYELQGTYMVKKITPSTNMWSNLLSFLLVLVLILASFLTQC